MSETTTPPQESVGGEPAGRPVGHDGTRVDVTERLAWSWGSGGALLMLLVSIAMLVGSIPLFVAAESATTGGGLLGASGVGVIVLGSLLLTGLSVLSPGQTLVVQLFGRYLGTIRRTGLVFTVPLTTRKRVSVRVRNFETSELKVNDADGNPINIAAIVVWQVADTAKASFAVQDYADFVRVQSESALRHVAMAHPYDQADEGQESLRGATELISGEIATEVAARVVIAGVEVIEARISNLAYAPEIAQEVAARVVIAGIEVVEARISNLAYAPEIAQAMLQRQQAGAIIAARSRIVEGAVSMVEDALGRLEKDGIVTLDDERRASMVSNLLVVLCSDSRATPVVNAGSLYS